MMTIQPPPLIILLSDFGIADPYVGILKGVISYLSPGTTCIDLTHEIPPGKILQGAVVLWQAIQYFPAGSIFLGVVDPGVGTSRRGILVKSGEQFFVGPDNGLFSFILADDFQAYELQNPAFMRTNPSFTFHGRDIFAPAAAHLANGIPIMNFGNKINNPVLLSTPLLSNPTKDELHGEILYADRFGNLLTSIGRFNQNAVGKFEFHPWIKGSLTIVAESIYSMDRGCLLLRDGKKLRWVNTFAEIRPNHCAFLVGSSDLLEIVANQNSAATLLGLEPGDIVILKSAGE